MMMLGTCARNTASSDPYWSSVYGLLKFNGVNGGTTFTNSVDPGVPTYYNAAALSTDQAISGTTSLKIGNAGSSYVGIGTTFSDPLNNFLGTQDVTIEFFLYVPTWPTATRKLSGCNDINGGINLTLENAGLIKCYVDAVELEVTAACSSAAWVHIALVRASGYWKLYVGGIGTSSMLDTTDYYQLYAYVVGNTTANTCTYYVDEFRVTVGIARYIANFTPPTEEFLVS